MISSITIASYRGIEHGAIDQFAPLSVLVGPNGCGKSSVLEALYIASSPQTNEALSFSARSRVAGERPARWMFHDGTDQHALLSVLTTEQQRRTVRLRLTGSSGINCTVQTESPSEPKKERQFQSEITAKSWSGERLDDPLIGVTEVRFLDPDLSREVHLHRLYTRVVELGLKDSLLVLLKELLPGMRNLEILTDLDEPILYAVFENQALPVGLAGEGIYWLIRMACEISSRKDSLILIEEPETHMHPAALRQAARVFRAATATGVQIVMTTHSLELIDALIDEESPKDLESLAIFRVQLVGGQLRTGRVPGPDAAVARLSLMSDLR